MTQARRPCQLVCRSERHPVVFDRIYIIYITAEIERFSFFTLPAEHVRRMFLVLLLSLYISVSQRSLSSVLRERQLSKADAKVRGFGQTAKYFLKKVLILDSF